MIHTDQLLIKLNQDGHIGHGKHLTMKLQIFKKEMHGLLDNYLEMDGLQFNELIE